MNLFYRNFLLFFISLMAGVAIFIYIGNIIGWEAIINAFEIFTKKEGAIIILLSFLIVFISAFRWREILRGQGEKNISLFNLFKTYLGGFSITYLFPVIILGSEAFRSYELHKTQKVKWDRSVSSVIIERILEWTVNLFVIVAGAFYFFYAISAPSPDILLIFGIAFLIVLALIVLVYIYIFKKKSFSKKIIGKFSRQISDNHVAVETEKELFKYFNLKNKWLWYGYFLSFLRIAVIYLRVWFIVYFLGYILSFMPAFSILGFSFLSTIIPIPTTLGVQELIQAFAFSGLGISLGTSTAFTMILRSGDIVVSLIGLALVVKTGYQFFKAKVFTK